MTHSQSACLGGMRKMLFSLRGWERNGGEMCLFGSNYPRARRPFPFSLFPQHFPGCQMLCGCFPFYLLSRLLLCGVSFCEGNCAARALCEGAFRPSASPTIAPRSRVFYLGFHTQITLLMGSTAEPAHSGAGVAEEVRKSVRMEVRKRALREKDRKKILLI